MNEFTSILNEKTCLAEIQNYFKFQVPTTSSKVPRSIAEREDPQAVTVTAAARSAATQRGLRGPVCRHRGSQHAARSADCGEELRGASARRWRSVAECMHGAKERSQREALAECCRSQRVALAEPAGSRSAPLWHQGGALRALCTPFLYMVHVGLGFFAAKSSPPLCCCHV